MRPQLHSPPMSSAGRLIAACLAVLAAGLVMLGCGSSNEVKVDLPPETVQAITEKLDQIQERFDAGDCTGPNSAETSLESLQVAVDGLEGVEQQFTDDMNQMLDNLGEQIADQCQEPEPTTSSTTDTTDTVPTTTDTVPTTTDTTTTTTTDTTKSTTTTTSTTPEPPTGPPGNPGNPNGNGPGGGVVPGGGKKENSGHIKKPKPEKDGKQAKDDRKERSR